MVIPKIFTEVELAVCVCVCVCVCVRVQITVGERFLIDSIVNSLCSIKVQSTYMLFVHKMT